MNPSSAASSQIQILWIKPAGFIHAESLREAVEAVHHGFAQAGIDAPIAENRILPGRMPIVFGAHLLGAGEEGQIPPESILYNLEQFGRGYAGSSPRYIEMLSRFRVWDGMAVNVDYLHRWGINPSARYVPLSYVPQLTRIAPAAEDIDVLFYGIQSERRDRVLKALESEGLRVIAANGLFGAERDALIARAKVVLNVHFAEGGRLEIPRLIYLLGNRKAVVSEVAPDTAASGLQGGFLEVPYEALAPACAELCRDEDRRHALAENGFGVVCETGARAGEIFRSALESLPDPPSAPSREAAPPGLPNILNIGSGRKFLPWCLNADIDGMWQPDCAIDIATPLSLGTPAPTVRFGEIRLHEGMFDAVVADHLLEHVSDLAVAMTNILTLLREGGTLYAEVPYDLSYGAWQDPFHVRAFNERSWIYYTDWHWYLGWAKARFDLAGIQFSPSDYGRRLLVEGLPLDEVLLRPRAIDFMRVELRKVPIQ